MPQPPLDVRKYLSFQLPHIHEKYPPGTGGTGPRVSWDGNLKGVEVIDNFGQDVKKFIDQLPTEPLTTDPYHKYPKFVQVQSELPNPITDQGDLQKALTTLPLKSVASVLTAYESGPTGCKVPRRIDAAGYESDGGEDEVPAVPRDDSKAWFWRYSKSPMGSGEHLLVKGDKGEKTSLVVRTTNSRALTDEDWKEFVVTGPYNYNVKSKASWYWSRTWGACKRLDTRWWVLTDWQKWIFGCFNDDMTHGWTSPILKYDSKDPTVLEALLYWVESAKGDKAGFKPQAKDVSSLPALFPSNPARRISVSGNRPLKPRDPSKPKTANESDVEEDDAEDGA